MIQPQASKQSLLQTKAPKKNVKVLLVHFIQLKHFYYYHDHFLTITDLAITATF